MSGQYGDTVRPIEFTNIIEGKPRFSRLAYITEWIFAQNSFPTIWIRRNLTLFTGTTFLVLPFKKDWVICNSIVWPTRKLCVTLEPEVWSPRYAFNVATLK